MFLKLYRTKKNIALKEFLKLKDSVDKIKRKTICLLFYIINGIPMFFLHNDQYTL